MKAQQHSSPKPSVFDPKIAEALRAAVQREANLTQDDIKAIQALVWDLPPDPSAVHEVLRDLAWDLEFTQDGPYFEQDKAMKEITATLQTIEEILQFEQKIGPAYDAMQADQGRGIPARDVFASIRAHHADQMKKA